MRRMTDAAIRRLPRPDKRVDHTDDRTPGLMLRVYPTGRKTWRMRYMSDGKTRVITLGSYPDVSLSDARGKASGYHDQIDAGKDPHAIVSKMPTVNEFSETFIDRHCKPNNKSWKATQQRLAADVLPHIGKMKLNAVSRSDIVSVLDRISDRGAYTTSNRTLAAVRKMFNFAVERGVIDNAPTTHIKMHKEQPRDVVLDDSAIRNVWHYDDKCVSALRLMLLTAARNDEVCGIELSEIDLDQKIWTLPKERSKNGLTHTVPLSTLAVEQIEILMESADGRHLFPANNKSGRLAHTTPAHAMARLFPDLSKTNARNTHTSAIYTPHDLRRTVATRLSGMGFNRLILDKVLNHKDNTVGGVYDRHTYDVEKREALDSWSRELSKIIS